MELKGLSVAPNKQIASTCADVSLMFQLTAIKNTNLFFLWRHDPTRAMAFSLSFLDHTQRRTTVDRTPLDE